ncbi:electron transfer flavoprotein alpha subunit [Azospirillum lipoferum]|uniref:Electron transfer flavoprotein subunit alpha/FixB family protein n=1 Tax=Azospirillum lipoferum TaxID=193 RepID=A0A5A9GIY9_AZOLI|nr:MULTISPECIES: electron transfer flavoprotein subunit alpha/FixB family protein [Azospirillum]KAA0594336.1 electron transfer flavoprotein subunit alpha/FixB family protein [Azospirillum lipoferum]MCP1613061.1 electron transfer flavoprotein alpha subunit [Azospirillum lipoferum]MDW5531261.1 electron transfer flavoprotein subunit alpha/FixB family protein [Azospirillum sp. NL1]
MTSPQIRHRVDPRAERAARTILTGQRPRLLRQPVATATVNERRRDPRAIRDAALVQRQPRPRYDWARDAASAGTTAAVGVAVANAPVIPLQVIAEPAYLVLAMLDRPGGEVSEHDRQVIAAARLLADAGGGAVVTVATGSGEALAEAGSDRHVALPDGWADDYVPERRAAAAAALMASLSPRHILFPDSPDGGDLARRVAAAAGERLFAGVQSLGPDRATRQSAGGSLETGHRPTRLMTVAADAFAPLDGVRHEARPLDLATPVVAGEEVLPRLGCARRLAVDPDALSLSETDFILSAGNGVTDWQSFAELGEALGATRAGSRVVCDAGHLPRERQVGASGTVVSARCYLAFGIAGAPQHLQGITGVKHVIAINTDLHAEMIKRADLSIVADAQEIMPALIRLIRERRHD